MMKLSKRKIRLTIEKFYDCLEWCSIHHYNNEQVVKFFGKKRAIKWCGSWNGYPDTDMILWYEKRYNTKWVYPYGTYYHESRFLLLPEDRTYKNC